jgi:hypothetical protein
VDPSKARNRNLNEPQLLGRAAVQQARNHGTHEP